MDIQPGDSVFTIASCGSNAITLLLDNPSLIIALDLAPAQICLAKLQVACIKHLSHQEMLDFLGINRMSITSDQREQIYEEKLKKQLEESVQMYWNNNKSWIKFGVLYCGRREEKLRASAEDYFNIALDENDIIKLLGMGDDMEEQITFFKKFILTSHFRKAFDCLVWKRILARYDFSKIANVDYASMWFERICKIVETIPAKKNYFLEYLLTGEISGNYSMPEYLNKENFQILKQRVDRIQWVETDLVSWFNQCQGNTISFNKICFSNVPDWLEREDFSKLIRQVNKFSKPNSRIAFSRLKEEANTGPKKLWMRSLGLKLTLKTRHLPVTVHLGGSQSELAQH